MKYGATKKVWQGILIMRAKPDIIDELHKQKFKLFDLEKPIPKSKFPQSEMDAVIAAFSWADKQEQKAKRNG